MHTLYETLDTDIFHCYRIYVTFRRSSSKSVLTCSDILNNNFVINSITLQRRGTLRAFYTGKIFVTWPVANCHKAQKHVSVYVLYLNLYLGLDPCQVSFHIICRLSFCILNSYYIPASTNGYISSILRPFIYQTKHFRLKRAGLHCARPL